MDTGQIWLMLGAVVLSSLLSAAGSGLMAAISVGSRFAKAQADATAALTVKVAALEVRVMNGLSATLAEIKSDVKALIIEANSRPCQLHTEALERLLERLTKVEDGQ